VEEFTGIAVFRCELNRSERSEELRASYVSRDALIHRVNTLIAVTQNVSCLCRVALPVFRQKKVTALLLLLTEDGIQKGPTIHNRFLKPNILFNFTSSKCQKYTLLQQFLYVTACDVSLCYISTAYSQ